MAKTIKVTITGDWKNTRRFLKRAANLDSLIIPILQRYGDYGLQNLRAFTPKDSGLTAEAWYYEINRIGESYELSFDNYNRTTQGTPIAILIQRGHATKNGGFVYGYDFINPSLRPIFEEMSQKIWEEVVNL